MDHDQRFKSLLRMFFADFLQLFFAEWAARFDLSQIEWLDKELLHDPPEGERHLLDMVARVPAREPVEGMHKNLPWLVLVHIEIESADQMTRIKPRLPHYYHHLRAAYQSPVLPIVIYLNVQLDGIGTDTVIERFWELEVNTFRYLYVGLPGLDGVKYVQGESWLGVALAALMRIPPDRVAWLGAEALRRLGTAPLQPQQQFLLADCVQAYLQMDDQQKQEYEQMLQQENYQGARKINKTAFDEGLEKGHEKGLEKGLEKGQLLAQREFALMLLEERCGPVSQKLRAHIESLPMDSLRTLAKQIARANSLAEAGLAQYADS